MAYALLAIAVMLKIDITPASIHESLPFLECGYEGVDPDSSFIVFIGFGVFD
jgi:hypothetical protein